jgi:hypothetical protein
VVAWYKYGVAWYKTVWYGVVEVCEPNLPSCPRNETKLQKNVTCKKRYVFKIRVDVIEDEARKREEQTPAGGLGKAIINNEIGVNWIRDMFCAKRLQSLGANKTISNRDMGGMLQCLIYSPRRPCFGWSWSRTL